MTGRRADEPGRRDAGRRRTVVVVAADLASGRSIAGMLSEIEYDVRIARSRADGLADVATQPPDLVVVGGAAGSNLVEDARELRIVCGCPILLVGTTPGEALQALESGVVADALPDPVRARELRARVERLVGDPIDSGVLVYGDLSIDLRARVVRRDGTPVRLSPREFDLLAFLAARPCTTFTRRELLGRVWGTESRAARTATVGEHVHRLRRKLEADPSDPRWIVTNPQGGYRFCGPGSFPAGQS